jgi:hypothetical protein
MDDKWSKKKTIFCWIPVPYLTWWLAQLLFLTTNGLLVGSKNPKTPLKPSNYILVTYFLAYLSVYVTYGKPT